MMFLHEILSLTNHSCIGCSKPEEPLDADKIIANAIKTHGLDVIVNKKIEFDFRDRHYSV